MMNLLDVTHLSISFGGLKAVEIECGEFFIEHRDTKTQRNNLENSVSPCLCVR